MIDIETIRAETSGVQTVNHLNNAGASLPPRQVVDAVVEYLRQEELAGGYETAATRIDDLDEVYRATSKYLSCQVHEVAFTTNASEGWWRAFSSVPLTVGDKILVNRSEFQANAFGWLQAKERGVDVEVVPNTAEGLIDLDALSAMLDEQVKLISMTMISMSNGAVQPAAAVGELVENTNAIFLLDACQAAGQLPLSVDEIKCDFLAYTGRKFMRGPRGTGILYARESVIDKLGPTPFVDGRSALWSDQTSYRYHDHARRFEMGEFSYGAKVGLGVATNYMLDIGIDAIAARIRSLATSLREQLASVPSVVVVDEGGHQSGIVTFTLEPLTGGSEPTDLSEIQAALGQRGINLSAPMCTNAQLDIGARSIQQVLRAGVHYFNTESELSALVEALADLVD